MRKGIELNPRDRRIHTFMGALARAFLNARDYESAEKWARTALERREDYPQAQLYLAAALGHLQRVPEARDVLRKCMRLLPGFALEYRSHEDKEHFLDGLRKAGLDVHELASKQASSGGIRFGRHHA